MMKENQQKDDSSRRGGKGNYRGGAGNRGQGGQGANVKGAQGAAAPSPTEQQLRQSPQSGMMGQPGYFPQYMYPGRPQYMVPIQTAGGSPSLGPMAGMIPQQGMALGEAAITGSPSHSPSLGPQVQMQQGYYPRPMTMPPQYGYYPPYGVPVMGATGSNPPRGPATPVQVPEKKILEIYDPKTNQKVLPTNPRSKPVVAPTPAPVAVEAPAAPVPKEEPVKKEDKPIDNAADIRAQFLAQARAALLGDKKAADAKPVAKAAAPAPAAAEAPDAPSAESSGAAERRAQEEDAKRKMEEAQRKREKLMQDTTRRSKEEVARLQMEEKAKEAERRKAELLAKQQAQEKQAPSEGPGLVRTTAAAVAAAPAPASNSIQARFGLATDSTPSAFPTRGARGTSAFGDNSNAPSAFGGRSTGSIRATNNPQTTSTMPEVQVDRSSGKIKYSLESLLMFKNYDKCHEVPEELDPKNIDYQNIITAPGPGERRGNRNDRHNDRNHNNDRHGGYNNNNNYKGRGGGNNRGRGGYNNGGNHRQGRGNNNNNIPPWQQQQNNNQGGYQGPVEPVKRTENAWVPTKAKDEHTATIKKVKGILNKLTKEKFDKLSQQMVEIPMTSVQMSRDVMAAVFDKALGEPHFSEMYADLCKVLADHSERHPWEFVSIVPQDGGYFWTSNMDPTDPNRLVGPYPTEDKARAEGNKATKFKRILLNKCQEEFEGSAAEEILKKVDAEEAELKVKREGLSETEAREIDMEILELDYKRKKAKRRMLGNINFIGELFKKEMLTARIMHECIIKLLGKPTDQPDEENIECLCKFLMTIGEQLDTREAKQWIDKYFQNLTFYAKNKNLSARHRFMAKDVIELRSNGWKKRREELKAQTLDEIKQAKEEEERKNQQNIERNRQLNRGGRGNRGGRDNRGHMGQQGNRSVMANAVFSSSMGSGFALGSGNARSLGGSQDVRNMGGSRRNTGAGSRPTGQGGMRPGGSGSMRPGGGGSMRPGGGSTRAVMRPGGSGLAPRSGGNQSGRNSGRGSAPAPAPKPELPMEKVKITVKSALEEFVNLRDVQEVVENIKELDGKNANATQMRQQVVRQGLAWVIEAKEDVRVQMYVILPALFTKGELKKEHFLQVFKEDFENIADILVDAPRGDQFIAKLIVELVAAKAISVSDLPAALSKLKVMDDYYCAKLAGAFLRELSKNDATKEAVKTSKINLEELLGGADKVPEFLERYELQQVFGGADSSATTEVVEKVKAGESADGILKWIQNNVSADVRGNKDFARNVVCAVLAHVESSEGLLSVPASTDDISEELKKKESEAITRYLPLLKRVLLDAPEQDRIAIQTHVLTGVVNMCNTQKFPNPNATVLRLFTELYDKGAVAEQSFLKWRDDGSKSAVGESANFQAALVKCSAWLQWLEKADEASDHSA